MRFPWLLCAKCALESNTHCKCPLEDVFKSNADEIFSKIENLPDLEKNLIGTQHEEDSDVTYYLQRYALPIMHLWNIDRKIDKEKLFPSLNF